MNFKIEPPPPDVSDVDAHQIGVAEIGILTAVSSRAIAKVGDPVVGGTSGLLLFPKHGGWSDVSTVKGYRFRRLRKGERLTFEGE